MNTVIQEPKKPLKDTLLKRIEEEDICPRPRLFYSFREVLVWSTWFLSVAVGALAVAISVFVVSHRQYALYEATHENLFTFMVEVLPYLWIITFGLMVYVAVYNIRHTRYGYRYPLSLVLSSSIVLSFAGGSSLQFFGLGYTIDNILGHQMPMYLSQEKLEQKLWQAPSDGRLIGKQVAKTVAPAKLVIFEDISGVRWQMDVSEVPARDLEHMGTGETVRLLGAVTNNELRIFHACGAFPWMLSQDVTLHDLDEERKKFVQQFYEHRQNEAARLAKMEGAWLAATPARPYSICANIAAARRLSAEGN